MEGSFKDEKFLKDGSRMEGCFKDEKLLKDGRVVLAWTVVQGWNGCSRIEGSFKDGRVVSIHELTFHP